MSSLKIFLPYISYVIGLTIYIYIYIYVIILFGFQNPTSLCVFRIIRLFVADIYPRCYHTHTQGYRSICPHLKNFVRTLKQCLVFQCLVDSYHDLISNSIIVFDACIFIADCVFSYLCLFMLTYIPPILYVRNWKDHVLSEDHMSWDFTLNRMVRMTCRNIL